MRVRTEYILLMLVYYQGYIIATYIHKICNFPYCFYWTVYVVYLFWVKVYLSWVFTSKFKHNSSTKKQKTDPKALRPNKTWHVPKLFVYISWLVVDHNTSDRTWCPLSFEYLLIPKIICLHTSMHKWKYSALLKQLLFSHFYLSVYFNLSA